MALINDNRLYSGGGVEFDLRPHTALYAQLAQRKAARDDAFDEYIRNLNKSVNGAGVRNLDRPIFDKMYQDFQKYGIENRDAIKSRKGGADIEYMKKFQDIQNLVSESKSEEEKKKPLTEILLDPSKRERLGDGVIDEITAHDQPLYVMTENGLERNPNRKSLDYSSVTFNPKPFEQDKYFKQFEDVKRTDLPPTVTTDPKTMTQTETKKSVFDQEAKDLIATRAVTDLSQNPSFRQAVKNLKPEDYNDFFKQNYGHDIQNEADLAAAFTLKGLQQNVTTTKVNPDTFERQKAMAGINDQYARRRLAIQDSYVKDRIKFRKASNQKEGENILNDYINRQFDENEKNIEVREIRGKWQPVRRMYAPKELVDKYTISKGNTHEKIPKFFISNDKKYVLPVYDNKSQGKDVDPILMETFKGDLGKIWLSRKDAKAEMADDLDIEEDEDLGGGYTPGPAQADDKPDEVEQGGHIFRKNKKTGEYEFVK